MTRKEEREQAAKQSIKGDSFEDGCIGKGYFIIGAEWEHKTLLEAICNWININAFKYGKVKPVNNMIGFDFCTREFIKDLKEAFKE